jgi:hypothetical protein
MDFNAEGVDTIFVLKAGRGITDDVRSADMMNPAHPILCFIN